MPPPGAAATGSFTEHFLYFGPAFNGDGLQPRLSKPVVVAVLLELVTAKGHVLNHAMFVKNERDVSCGRN